MLAAICASVPVIALLAALVVALLLHPYAGRIGWRYMRSKKRRTVSVITFIAVSGVALGVAALLAVMSITSGFQEEFRTKVLGVNAHVLVLKYGLDFEEYRDVAERAREMPEVSGAAPFLINQMMIGRREQPTDEEVLDDGPSDPPRISGVLVKGVDPDLMPTVLDLPSQIVEGGMRGLRAPGAAPPTRPEDLLDPVDDDWGWLNEVIAADAGVPADAGVAQAVELDAGVALPEVDVPTPEQAEASLGESGPADLPDDALLDELFAEEDEAFVQDEETGDTRDLPGIIVGRTLATNLGLSIGDRVHVVSPLAGLDTSFIGGRRETPRSHDFRVIGIFEAGFHEYDTRLVYVDLYEAQRFFDHGDSVTGVEIRLHDIDAAPVVARRLERVLGGGPYHTMDWQELNRNLFTALEIQKLMLSLVIATIILVAAFNVIATLIMIVPEKKREIAILKAMGASNWGVLLIFMVQGLLIGLVGTLIGLLLGGGVVWYLERFQFPLDPHVYLIDHLPVRSSPLEFVVTIAIAVGICIIATVLPSAWAARLLPADGVRYE
jgi:lipoprotein-releasing system permease protein